MTWNQVQMAEVSWTGRAGEAAMGIGRTGKIGVPGPITGRTRFPDYFREVLREIKNVRRQGLTSQIRDYIQMAKDAGVPFELIVRAGIGTRISGPLQAAADAGLVTIRRLLK
jgi:hypothetical protein